MSKLEKKYFDSKIYKTLDEELDIYDVKVNTQKCGSFKREKVLCDNCYNLALVEKMLEFTSLNRLDFINYQINLQENPLDWLSRLSAFLYDNEDSFEYDVKAHLEFQQIVHQGIDQLKGKAVKNTEVNDLSDFIHQSRIEQLNKIECAEFDLSKLIKLLDELNSSFKMKNYFAVLMISRAVIDHIPPIFGEVNFQSVAAQYGNKSFKECMSQLNGVMRKIADGYLHLQIRKKESIPNSNQINFSQSLDVLLGEICRVLE